MLCQEEKRGPCPQRKARKTGGCLGSGDGGGPERPPWRHQGPGGDVSGNTQKQEGRESQHSPKDNKCSLERKSNFGSIGREDIVSKTTVFTEEYSFKLMSFLIPDSSEYLKNWFIQTISMSLTYI